MNGELTPAEHALIVAALSTSTRSPAHLAFLAAPAVEKIIADRLAVLDDYLGCAAGFHAEVYEAAIERRGAS